MGKELLGSIELNRIYQMNCLTGMKLLPDRSVDLICIDPPYNIGKDKWDKWKSVDDYIEFMGHVFTECERVLKHNGSFYFFHNDFRQMWKLDDWVERNTKLVFKQMIVWNKRFEGAKNKGFLDGFIMVDELRNYQQMAEYCLFYTFEDETGWETIKLDVNNFPSLRNYFKEFQEALGITKKSILEKVGQRADHCFRYGSTQWDLPTLETYEALKELKLQKPFNYREWYDLKNEFEDYRLQYESKRVELEEENRYTFNNLKTLHSVWNFEIAHKQGHVTPKPIHLIQNIILHSSNKNDIVLDCFMGSGTTAVACQQLGRKWIGFETEPQYIQISNMRLDSMAEVAVTMDSQ